jgi:hypothetical protein
MTNEPKQPQQEDSKEAETDFSTSPLFGRGEKQVQPEDIKEAEAGEGDPGVNLFKAEMTQVLTGVNAPDAIIPSNNDPEMSKKQVEAMHKQEEGTGIDTTEGYIIDESGRLDNFAIEPPMYVEGEEPPTR